MAMRARLFLLPAAAALAAGCGGAPPASGYFPLDAGHAWTYDLKTEHENNLVTHETLVLRTLGRETLDDGPAWRRRSEAGVDYWLRADDAGIYRVATKSDLDAEPKPDATRRFVLKAPFAPGTSWQSTTTAYLLARRTEFPREIRHTHPSVPMVYTIEAVDQAVETRAGRFERCVRVKGQAVLRLFADPVVGWRDMPLSTTEWYCDGVGLVKLVREEPAQSTFLAGGTMTLELTSWQ
ncbi:MAG: hypothetical protein J0L57_16670 [Burkholderiales bacterium]|jgi:hypothetical protein|nr:hypothetical protein [Burkholderiales bacterium]